LLSRPPEQGVEPAAYGVDVALKGKDQRHLMYTYPHKIENGEGQLLTFFGVVRDRDGDRLKANFLLRLVSVRRCICTIFRKRP
jgi:hypothetical protein